MKVGLTHVSYLNSCIKPFHSSRLIKRMCDYSASLYFPITVKAEADNFSLILALFVIMDFKLL